MVSFEEAKKRVSDFGSQLSKRYFTNASPSSKNDQQSSSTKKVVLQEKLKAQDTTISSAYLHDSPELKAAIQQKGFDTNKPGVYNISSQGNISFIPLAQQKQSISSPKLNVGGSPPPSPVQPSRGLFGGVYGYNVMNNPQPIDSIASDSVKYYASSINGRVSKRVEISKSQASKPLFVTPYGYTSSLAVASIASQKADKQSMFWESAMTKVSKARKIIDTVNLIAAKQVASKASPFEKFSWGLSSKTNPLGAVSFFEKSPEKKSELEARAYLEHKEVLRKRREGPTQAITAAFSTPLGQTVGYAGAGAAVSFAAPAIASALTLKIGSIAVPVGKSIVTGAGILGGASIGSELYSIKQEKSHAEQSRRLVSNVALPLTGFAAGSAIGNKAYAVAKSAKTAISQYKVVSTPKYNIVKGSPQLTGKLVTKDSLVSSYRLGKIPSNEGLGLKFSYEKPISPFTTKYYTATAKVSGSERPYELFKGPAGLKKVYTGPTPKLKIATFQITKTITYSTTLPSVHPAISTTSWTTDANKLGLSSGKTKIISKPLNIKPSLLSEATIGKEYAYDISKPSGYYKGMQRASALSYQKAGVESHLMEVQHKQTDWFSQIVQKVPKKRYSPIKDFTQAQAKDVSLSKTDTSAIKLLKPKEVSVSNNLRSVQLTSTKTKTVSSSTTARAASLDVTSIKLSKPATNAKTISLPIVSTKLGSFLFLPLSQQKITAAKTALTFSFIQKPTIASKTASTIQVTSEIATPSIQKPTLVSQDRFSISPPKVPKPITPGLVFKPAPYTYKGISSIPLYGTNQKSSKPIRKSKTRKEDLWDLLTASKIISKRKKR